MLQELRQNGFYVRITHHRVFDGIGILEPGPKYKIDNVLTRGQFERARDEQALEFDEWGANHPKYSEFVFPEQVPYGLAVMPTAGFTTVEVTTPDDIVVVKKYNFGKTEPFCRKKGVRAALGRVMKALREEYQGEFFINQEVRETSK